jgi:hypothetical protein
MSLFSADEMAKLAGPHVSRAWFGEFDLPSGYAYLHNGVGTVTVAGQEWRGLTDPLGGVLVSIDAVEDPRFGQAAAVGIVLSGVNVAFWKSVKADARDLEGRTAILHWASFDPETGELGMFKTMFPGKMSAPSLHRQGLGTRLVGLTIEGFWQSQNYPFGGRWNFSDQMRRYPGDKGGQFIGQKVAEQWK